MGAYMIPGLNIAKVKNDVWYLFGISHFAQYMLHRVAHFRLLLL